MNRQEADKKESCIQHIEADKKESCIQHIGIISSCFPEKFGIPRQSGLAVHSSAVIDFYPPFNRYEMICGLEEFSHIWVQFLFHQAVDDGWRPTVRPPRLGGQKRCGVFACRTPHRPNHIGLSAVRLLHIEQGKSGPRLHLGGIDFLDNTPVLDIKPYLSYSDAIPDAAAGFTAIKESGAPEQILFTDEAAEFCRHYQLRYQRPLQDLIIELITANPRPRSQKRKKEFGMRLWNLNIRWQTERWGALVTAVNFFAAMSSPSIKPGKQQLP